MDIRKFIEDIYDSYSNLINQDYDTYDRWVIEPRIIKTKKYVKVRTIVQIKIKVNTYGLYINEKEYCDSNNIRVVSKRTGMENTKKIGFLSKTYIKLASLEYYIREIIKEMNLDNKITDIAKKFLYERKYRPKVLVVYIVES